MRKVGPFLVVMLLLSGTAVALAGGPPHGAPDADNPTLETISGGVVRPYAGTVLPAPRAATDTATPGASGSTGPVTFYPNTKLTCSTTLAGAAGCGQLLEPEVASGPDGTIYVTAQEGVPGGVDFWRRNPGSFQYVQLHKTDQNPVLTKSTGLALGGGDNDLSISSDGKVYVSSL